MEVKLKTWQDKFIFSKSRYPAMYSSWATGKTMCLILRAMLYSEEIPDNLGIIFRKEYTDLRDSTVKDFERYTGLKVDSQRNVTLPNASIIMFRHIEELNNIQNINLGWYGIEQADELDTEEEFYMLFGRLRRFVNPSAKFKDLGLPERSGFVIGNAGDHWGKSLWKENKLEGGECIEAVTYDNQDVLPKDFIDSLKILEKNKPEIYKRFVLNDWSVTSDQYVLIRGNEIDLLKGVFQNPLTTRRIIACDPSLGGDICQVYAFENTKIVDEMELRINDTMKIVAELQIFAKRNNNTDDFAIDSIGIGAGICDRLEELGKTVIRINSAENAFDTDRYANRRAEIWCYVSDKIQRREIEYFEDKELRRQLTAVRYDPKVMNSQGYWKLEPKQDTKKRLGRSPDKADAYVYGIWGLGQVIESMEAPNNLLRKKHVYSGAGGW